METAHVPCWHRRRWRHWRSSPMACTVDATFGRGGHSRLILAQLGPAGRLIGGPRPRCLRAGRAARRGLTLVQSAFSRLGAVPTNWAWHGWTESAGYRGVVAQLDDATRGFSSASMRPADMRMESGKWTVGGGLAGDAEEGEISESSAPSGRAVC